MKRILKVLFVNLLWLLFSLPVVTVGAATCAAFYVTMKIVDNEDKNIFLMFWKGFKENFKQGTVMWAFTAPCIYAAYLLWGLVVVDDEFNYLVMIGAVLYTLLIAVIIVYAYPLIARYKNSLRNIVKNAVGVTMAYIKSTLFILMLVGLECAFIFWNQYTMFAGLSFGPGLIIYTISMVAKRSFQKIERDNS